MYNFIYNYNSYCSYIVHIANKQLTRQPSNTILQAFGLKLGQNTISCTLRKSKLSANFHIYMYDLFDFFVVMDIDGTITRSDVRG